MAGKPTDVVTAKRGHLLRRAAFALLFAGLLLIGLVQLAALFADDEPTPPLRMNGANLIASGMLSFALHQQDGAKLERAPAVGPRVRDAQGATCRRFAGRPAVEGAVTGTACLIENEWRIVDLHQDVAPPKLR